MIKACPACQKPLGQWDQTCAACGHDLAAEARRQAEAAAVAVVSAAGCPACAAPAAAGAASCAQCGVDFAKWRLAQEKRKAAQASADVEKASEAEKGLARQNRSHSGAMNLMLTGCMMGNGIFGALAFMSIPGSTDPAGLLIKGVGAWALVVFAAGAWGWKKWGLYGLLAAAATYAAGSSMAAASWLQLLGSMGPAAFILFHGFRNFDHYG